MKYETYLPIGSVVLLKGGTKRAMITGFCLVSKEDPNKVWDYTGCMYPEGVVSSEQTLLFDHNQIERIFCLGFSDDEEKKFKENLKNTMNAIKNMKIS